MTDLQYKIYFQRRIKKLIEDFDGTWMDIANETGIPYGSLQALVSGKIYPPNPKMTTLINLALFFDVKLNWLILGDKDE